MKTVWEQTVKDWLWRLLAVFFILSLVFALCYRYSEQAGLHVRQACIAAVGIGGISALISLCLVWRFLYKDKLWAILWVFLTGIIRLLLAFVGVVIIAVFTDIHRGWFFGFAGLFYVVFLLFETWLLVSLLSQRDWASEAAKEQESSEYDIGNTGQFQTGRRSYD